MGGFIFANPNQRHYVTDGIYLLKIKNANSRPNLLWLKFEECEKLLLLPINEVHNMSALWQSVLRKSRLCTRHLL